MLQLLQIINHMLVNLDYSVEEVDDIFNRTLKGEYDLEVVLESIGVEATESQYIYIYESLPKYKSALHITALRVGA